MQHGLACFQSRFGELSRIYSVEKPGVSSKEGKPFGMEPLAGSDNSSLRFRRHESVRDGFGRICDELIERACARIIRPGGDRTEDLHQVRVTIKRLRALLKLVRPVISPALFKEENDRLKKAAGRLSPFRDTAVSSRTLKELAGTSCNEKARGAFDLAIEGMHKGRAARTRFYRGRERAMQSAFEDLRSAARSIRDLLITTEDWPAIEPGLKKEYRATRNSMSRALQRNDDDKFHAWRIHTKYLFYQLQTLESVRFVRLARLIKRLRKLEDDLGRDHDLMMLKHLLDASPEKYGGRQAVKTMTRLLRKRSQELRKKCAALGGRLLSEKPARFVSRMARHWREQKTAD
jgi:CHAD domain-containing protein